MSYNRILKIVLIVVSIFWVLPSCNDAQKRDEMEKRRQKIAQRANEVQAQVDGELSKNKAIEDEIIANDRERRKKENADKVMKWLQGTWEYSGYDPIAGQMSVRLIIDGDYATWYGNGKLMDSGHLEIDPEEGRISFGQYTGLDIDMARQIIYTGGRSEGTYMRKSTGGGSSGSSYSGRGSNGNTSRVTTFTTSSEVMAYVGNKFRNRLGNVIRVKSYGIICNGTQITNGVRVVSFNGSRATLTATSPYAQGTQHFYVDASRGTITDGTGDVFYIQ